MSGLSDLELDVRLGQIWDGNFDLDNPDKAEAEYEALHELFCALVLNAKGRGVSADDVKTALESAIECVDDIYAGTEGFARL